jgi:hypothetical protein
MFVPKSRQKTIFDLEFDLPEKMLKRIKQTWAEVFLQIIMPILMKAEEDFADLYCRNNGAPNTPVALLLGVLILKDIFDLTDEETLEHLEYNILWQYALDIRFEQAHICRKTLHNFRMKLLQSGRHRKIFNRLTKKIIDLFGLNVGRQRLDSTHVVGNMKIVGRLGLFVQTIEQFLFKLKRMAARDPKFARVLKELPEHFHERYLEREGYFGDARGSQAPRRLQTCARDIWQLLEIFTNHPKISNLKQFKTLKRLFKEQCEIITPEGGRVEVQAILPEADEQASTDEPTAPPPREKPASGESPGEPVVEVKDKSKIGSDSLQSPTDTDATYGYKGKGYECQVAETCDSDNAFQVITQTDLNGADVSDQTQTIPMIDKLDEVDLKPKELQVDSGYVSGENIVEAEDKGVELVGPLPGKPAPEKMSLADFQFNENGTRIERCPNQKTPIRQGDSNVSEYWAEFARRDCSGCPFSEDCPVKGKRKRRVQWSREKIATARRQREVKTREFKERYKTRSGIESTNSEIKHKHGAAKLKVRGHKRIELAMTLKSLAVNVKRMILYVLAKLNRVSAEDAPNSACAVISVLATALSIFIGFAQLFRQKTSSALKGDSFEEESRSREWNSLATSLNPLRG